MLTPSFALGNELVRPFRNSDGRWGYVDSNHCWAIRPRFDLASWFREGLARVVISSRVGFIDLSGRIVIPPTFVDPRLNRQPLPTFNSPEEAQRAAIELGINSINIDRIHSEAWYFSEGLAAVLIGDSWGYIDRTGSLVIPARFSEAYAFSDGLAKVKIGNRYGYIDRFGGVRINPQFEDAGSFSGRLAAVKFEGFWGFIDVNGRMKINPIYQYADSFSDGLASVRVADRMGYIDGTGRMVIRPQFIFAQRFSEGLAAVEVRERLWGYIDRSGRSVINPQFDLAGRFQEGLAGVGITPVRFIDRSGNTVIHIPSAFVSESFRGGIGSVVLGSRLVSIDRAGTILLDPTCGAM